MTAVAAVRYVLLTFTGIGMMFLLTDRKYSLKKSLTILFIGTLGIVLINLLVFWLFGIQALFTLYPVTTNGLALAVIFLFSKQKGLPLLFNLLTAISTCGIVTLPGFLLTYVYGFGPEVDILSRLVLTIPLLYLLYRFFRPAYLATLSSMQRGWGLFCLMPLVFYGMFLYLLNFRPRQDYPESIGLTAAALVMLIAAYGIVFILFHKITRENTLREERQLLEMQVSALRRQKDMAAASEEKMRLYRHDMRFTLHTLAAMLERGDTAGALEYLGKSDAKLKDTALNHYCSSPVLDALLSYYEEQARARGIQVDIRMTLAPELPVDETELSTVFANALENAIHACEKLPEGAPRHIEVSAVSSPMFCAEFANTCDGTVVFDSDGLPTSSDPEHGVGTRSMAAFFTKHKAVYQYSVTEDGMFRLRFLINRSCEQDGGASGANT
ncbi:MAG: GHKL domain-containing protein [Enterocloster asparagiformis]|nr:GHKL domain-containing protein [Enterocloster asparagiformis]